MTYAHKLMGLNQSHEPTQPQLGQKMYPSLCQKCLANSINVYHNYY